MSYSLKTDLADTWLVLGEEEPKLILAAITSPGQDDEEEWQRYEIALWVGSLKLLDREVESARSYLALRDVARDLWAAYMNKGNWLTVNWYEPDRTDDEITFEERISGFMDYMFMFLLDHGGVPYWLLERLKRDDDRVELGSENAELFPSDPESLVVTNVDIPTNGGTVSIAVVPRGVNKNNVQVGVVVMVDPTDERYKSLVREVTDRAAVLAAFALENTQESS